LPPSSSELAERKSVVPPLLLQIVARTSRSLFHGGLPTLAEQLVGLRRVAMQAKA
jgi:hypothetical protein